MTRNPISLLPTFGSRRRAVTASAEPSTPPAPIMVTAEPPPDPQAGVLGMLDGVGCLTRKLTSLANDLRNHPDLSPEQRADAAGRVKGLHEQLEAVCSAVSGLGIDLGQHHRRDAEHG